MRLFKALKPLAALARDERGSMGIIFAAVFSTLIIGCGVVVDLSRVLAAHQILQQSADSALLAAAGKIRLEGYPAGDAQAADRVVEATAPNFDSAITVSSFGALGMIYSADVDYAPASGGWEIALNASGRISAGLTRLLGYKAFDVKASTRLFLPDDPATAAKLSG